MSLPGKKRGWKALTRRVARDVLGCRVKDKNWRQAALAFLAKVTDPEEPDGDGVPVQKFSSRYFFRFDVFQERISKWFERDQQAAERLYEEAA